MGWIRDRALTLVLMLCFGLFLVGQLLTGQAEFNSTQREHGAMELPFAEYMQTGHPWEAVFENWESEFLQMAVVVLLTTCLVQKGSPESRRPGVIERQRGSPARAGIEAGAGAPPRDRTVNQRSAATSGPRRTRSASHQASDAAARRKTDNDSSPMVNEPVYCLSQPIT